MNTRNNLLSRRIFPFVSLGILFGLAYMWRASSWLEVSFVSSHISNFAITGLAALVLIGVKDFIDIRKKTKVAQILLTLLLVNVILETVTIGDVYLFGVTIGAFNVADPIDAVFGVVVIVLTGIIYWNTAKNHLRTVPV